MKIYHSLFVLSAVAMCVACSSDDDVSPIVKENKGVIVVAKLPQDLTATTRVAYDDDTEGTSESVKPSWQSTDQISYTLLWNNEDVSTVEKRTTIDTEKTIFGNTFTFTLDKTPKADSYIYCWHPTGDISTITNDESASTCVLGFTESSGDYIFADISSLSSKNYLVGCANYTGQTNLNVTFLPILTLLKFYIKVPTTYSPTSIKSVEIKQAGGGNLRKISNSTTVTITGGMTPTFAWSGFAAGRYYNGNVNAPLGVAVNDYKEAVFYALMPPHVGSFAPKGIKLTITDNNDHTYSYASAETKKELEAGKWYSIKAKVTAE